MYQWVKENTERVGAIRDKVTLSEVVRSADRKKRRDKWSAERELQAGVKILLRASGSDNKLTDAWEGPYIVLKKLGHVSYMIDVGKSKGRVAHINVLKEFKERQEDVTKITTI